MMRVPGRVEVGETGGKAEHTEEQQQTISSAQGKGAKVVPTATPRSAYAPKIVDGVRLHHASASNCLACASHFCDTAQADDGYHPQRN